MQIWLKITLTTIKTVAITFPIKILTRKSNIKTFMGLRLTWSVNSSFSFKKTPINMNKQENLNISFFLNFFKLKIFSINFLSNILSKSCKIIFIKIICIVLSIWNPFRNFFLLKKTIKIQQIINSVMLIKSLPNTWLKWKRLSNPWKQFLKIKNFNHRPIKLYKIIKILIKSFINLKWLLINLLTF